MSGPLFTCPSGKLGLSVCVPAPWPMLTPENQDSVLVLETSQLHRESHLCGLGKGQSQGESVSRRVCYVGTGKDLGVGVGVFEKGRKRQGG